jgi:maltose alpha-D-glucosyltransferase/alpha-amylase
VAAQDQDPTSLLNFTRRLISLRREHPALRHGQFSLLPASSRRSLAYLRTTDAQAILVAMNFSSRADRLALPDGSWQVLLSTQAERASQAARRLDLGGHEVCLLSRVPG